jgi:hypothetical protein
VDQRTLNWIGQWFRYLSAKLDATLALQRQAADTLALISQHLGDPAQAEALRAQLEASRHALQESLLRAHAAAELQPPDHSPQDSTPNQE